MHTILVIDDDLNILKSITRLFKHAPCTVNQHLFNIQLVSFSDPTDAMNYLTNNPVDLIISDYKMPLMDGITFLLNSKVLQPLAARIILSGYADLDIVLKAVNDVGISRFLAKPWNDYELITAVAQVLFTRDMYLSNLSLSSSIDPDAVHNTTLLEIEDPGLMKVNWGANGEILLDS